MTPNDVILTSFDPVSIAFLEYWVWSFIPAATYLLQPWYNIQQYLRANVISL